MVPVSKGQLTGGPLVDRSQPSIHFFDGSSSRGVLILSIAASDQTPGTEAFVNIVPSSQDQGIPLLGKGDSFRPNMGLCKMMSTGAGLV